MNDTATLNAKGHVKLELYNNDGVFYTKEKKNLVVQSANKIVAEMMADPAKVVRVSEVDKGDASPSANSDLLYPFHLSVQAEEKVKFENNWGATNTTAEFQLEELKNITSLDKVTVGVSELIIDKDVFLLDAANGRIKFAVAPTEAVIIHLHRVKNPYMRMIAGTEVVKAEGMLFERADVADTATKKYQVDARTGQVLFATAVKNVEVSYDYHMNYSLGFMGLGGKRHETDPNFQPVEFGNSNKLDIDMKNEFAGSRVPIHFPASIEGGATELDPAIPTQPITSVMKDQNITIIDNGDTTSPQKITIYELPNQHDGGFGLAGRSLLEIVSAKNVTTDTDIKGGVTVVTNTLSKVEVEFADADVSIGDEVYVEYRLKVDNSHLVYQLSQSPVVELVSVKHTSAVDSSDVREYKVIDSGLKPQQGDVWISNSGTGHITFSLSPVGIDPAKPAPEVHTPGQLTVEYRVNSGTIIKFVADFPKGVPAPTLADKTDSTIIVSGQTSVSLSYAIAKDKTGMFIEPEVIVNSGGVATTLSSAEYSISTDGKTITPNNLLTNDTVTVNYQYEKETHDIYQVAMFDDKVGGKMFNISGIGPVTKDKNTGMRVTWSVTF